MVIWTRIFRKNIGNNKSTAIYLLFLAGADSGLLLFFLFTDSLPTGLPSVMVTEEFCFFYSYIGYPLFFFFIVASIWLIVGLTVNRFIMVTFPVKARVMCSNARAYLGSLAIIICSFVINFPHFFNYRPEKTSEGYINGETEYAKRGDAKRYEFWVHCMFLVLAPWILVAFFNCGIVFSLTKRAKMMTAKNAQKQSKERRFQDREMTATLFAVTISFLVLLAWQCITQCFFMLEFGKTTGEWDIVEKSYVLAKLGVVINSSINFFLYCLTGSIFRKELRMLFISTRRLHSSSVLSSPKVTVDSSVSNTQL